MHVDTCVVAILVVQIALMAAGMLHGTRVREDAEA